MMSDPSESMLAQFGGLGEVPIDADRMCWEVLLLQNWSANCLSHIACLSKFNPQFLT